MYKRGDWQLFIVQYILYKFVSFTCYCVLLYNKELQVSHSLHTCNMFTADRAKGVVLYTK